MVDLAACVVERVECGLAEDEKVAVPLDACKYVLDERAKVA